MLNIVLQGKRVLAGVKAFVVVLNRVLEVCIAAVCKEFFSWTSWTHDFADPSDFTEFQKSYSNNKAHEKNIIHCDP